MNMFDEREKAFEAKFAHDEEMQFKAMARRNKKLGEWAAGKLGLGAPEAADYAKQVISADMAEPGDEDVFRKVFADFAERGVTVDETDLRVKMAELLIEAKAEIMTQG